jgi:hypothetical protein
MQCRALLHMSSTDLHIRQNCCSVLGTVVDQGCADRCRVDSKGLGAEECDQLGIHY